jgi:hypothetical protein
MMTLQRLLGEIASVHKTGTRLFVNTTITPTAADAGTFVVVMIVQETVLIDLEFGSDTNHYLFQSKRALKLNSLNGLISGMLLQAE